MRGHRRERRSLGSDVGDGRRSSVWVTLRVVSAVIAGFVPMLDICRQQLMLILVSSCESLES